MHHGIHLHDWLPIWIDEANTIEEITEENRMKSKKTKRPSPWIYLPLVGLANIFTRFVKQHKYYGGEVLKGLVKEPLLVIGNHTSFYDFLYMARILYPHRINFVVAAKYFRFHGLSLVFRLGRSIPKNLFSADIRTVARTISIIKQGGIVGIYPEGQISLGGITLPLPEGIGKLVKHLGVPVVMVKTYGGGFVDPPWSNRHRRGIVESHISVVLRKEQVQTLSLEAIDEALKGALAANPYQWQAQKGYEYRGKELTDGLTNILYICPNCHDEFKLDTAGDKLTCGSCGMKVTLQGSGHLNWENTKAYFNHIGDWYEWEHQEEEKAVLADENFCYGVPVELAMYRREGDGIEAVGNGIMTINREVYIYNGTFRGKEIQMEFLTRTTRYVPFDGGRNFQIYADNELHEFRPDPGVKSVKAALIGETMYYLQTKK
jgi:1-acyl-sn-glycerol-3-phosphate acyltransferase/DNA-directed RNA polymerase subunit RPC12/RpoP